MLKWGAHAVSEISSTNGLSRLVRTQTIVQRVSISAGDDVLTEVDPSFGMTTGFTTAKISKTLLVLVYYGYKTNAKNGPPLGLGTAWCR